jgi:hypothetical protein
VVATVLLLTVPPRTAGVYEGGRVDDLGFTVQTVIADWPGELADAIADLPSPDGEAYDGD